MDGLWDGTSMLCCCSALGCSVSRGLRLRFLGSVDRVFLSTSSSARRRGFQLAVWRFIFVVGTVTVGSDRYSTNP